MRVAYVELEVRDDATAEEIRSRLDTALVLPYPTRDDPHHYTKPLIREIRGVDVQTRA